MGRTIYVVDADDARAALEQIKTEAVADGGEDGGRIAALTGIARVFLDRADQSRYRPPQLLKAFSLYRAACELIFAMLEFDPVALETLIEAMADSSAAEKAPAVLHRINRRLARDWEIKELERKEQREAQRKRQAMPFPKVE
jgi:hypothetical protein